MGLPLTDSRPKIKKNIHKLRLKTYECTELKKKRKLEKRLQHKRYKMKLTLTKHRARGHHTVASY